METIDDWLGGLGLEQIQGGVRSKRRRPSIASHLSEPDLKELGVSLGHRKLILAAISSLDRHGLAPSIPSLARPARRGCGRAGCRPAAPQRPVLRPGRLDGAVGRARPRRHAGADASLPRQGGRRDHALWRLCRQISRRRRARLFRMADGLRGPRRAFHPGRPRGPSAVEALRSPDGEPLKARIGIASGHVVVGDIAGSSANERGSIAGDTPNLAARLQGTARSLGRSSWPTHTPPGRATPSRSTASAQGVEGLQVAHPAVHGPRRTRGGKPLRRRARRACRSSSAEPAKSACCSSAGRWQRAARAKRSSYRERRGSGNRASSMRSRSGLQENQHELIRLQCSPYHATSAFYPIIQRLSRLAGFSPADDQVDAHRETPRDPSALRTKIPRTSDPIYAELLSLDVGDEFKPLDLSAQQRKELIVRTLANRLLLAARPRRCSLSWRMRTGSIRRPMKCSKRL